VREPVSGRSESQAGVLEAAPVNWGMSGTIFALLGHFLNAIQDDLTYKTRCKLLHETFRFLRNCGNLDPTEIPILETEVPRIEQQ